MGFLGELVHFLILYENPAGDLYDTYFWQRYASRQGVVDLGEGNLEDRLFRELFSTDSSNESWWIYPAEDRERVLNTLQDVGN